MSTFQDRLASLSKRVEENLTPKYLKIIRKTIRQLEKSGIKGQALQVGDQLPEVDLSNQDGSMVNCNDLCSKRPLIITFYRGFWCPYCNLDMSNLQTYVPEIEKLGATLIAISPEKPEYSQRIINRHKLTFDILFDKRNDIADSFGLRFEMPKDLVELYRDKFNYNLKLYHGDDDWTLPVPARFLIDTNGIIRYAENTPDYTTRPDPDDLIKVLKQL